MEKQLQDILEIVGFLKDNSVTKEEAKSFATKDDLKLFATKLDLERFATKQDLERFATKEDLERYATKEGLRESTDSILTKMDGFITLHQKVDLELTSMRQKYNRLEDTVQQMQSTIQLMAKHLNLEIK